MLRLGLAEDNSPFSVKAAAPLLPHQFPTCTQLVWSHRPLLAAAETPPILLLLPTNYGKHSDFRPRRKTRGEISSLRSESLAPVQSDRPLRTSGDAAGNRTHCEAAGNRRSTVLQGRVNPLGPLPPFSPSTSSECSFLGLVEFTF